MNYVLKISVFLALGVLSLFLQSFNFFKIGSINPNLILVFFASILILYSQKTFFHTAGPVFLGILVWSYFFIPFWLEGILILGILISIGFFVKFNFTGNNLIDIILLVMLLTPAFYLLSWIIGLQNIDWYIGLEILYNALITTPFYFIVKWLKYNTK